MDVLQHAPTLTPAEASDVARRLYGLDADASPLPSERDQNFLLQTATGDRFVLKVANGTDERALLEAQTAALAHVARVTTLCPRVIADLEDNGLAEIASAKGAR